MDEPDREDLRFKPLKMFSVCYTPPDVDVSGRTPIIFLHGLLATNRTWNSVKIDISKKTGRKVYAIDLRNHGKSEWSDEFSLTGLVDDLENFMVTENIPKAILVGHSLGSRTVLGLALRRPEMVERLVVEEPSMEDTEKSINLLEKMSVCGEAIQQALKFIPSTVTESEAQKKVQTYVASTFPEWYGNASAKQSIAFPFHKEKSGEFVWDLNAAVFTKLKSCYSHLFSIDLENDPVYHGEILALVAENSVAVTPESVDRIFKYFPKCQVLYFKDGYHTLHAEFPEKYIQTVLEFINEK